MTKSRSAVTGKFVTAKKAKRSPKKTVTETITPYNRNKKDVIVLLQAAIELLKKLK